MSILYDSDDNKDLYQDEYFEDFSADQEDLIKEVFDQVSLSTLNSLISWSHPSQSIIKTF